jgi:hypothetical protein
MNIFGILKLDDEDSLKENPSVGVRLDPLSVSSKQSSVTTTPLGGVSVIHIQSQIY